MKLNSALTAFILASLVGARASAQEPAWLPDRSYREGPGILVGNFELHPGVGVDFGYDSNYFHRNASSDATKDEDVIGALRLRASPSFSVATLGAQRRADGQQPSVGFRFEIGATYNEFIPVSGSQGGRDALRKQRNVDGTARIGLDILPGRPWSGRIYGALTRAIRPTQEGLPGTNFNRLLPGGGAELVWTPGSGMLDWRLGDEVSATIFESGDFSSLNSIRNDVFTRGRWRFLPRTAMVYDGKFTYMTYPKGSSSSLNKTSSHPVRARIGATGLITPSFGVLAMIGWGASFYSSNTHDFNSVLAQAELKWYLTPSQTLDPMKVNPLLSGISVGFVRDFEDSFLGTYLEKDQGYINFNYLFGGTFLLVANVAVGAVVFPKQVNPDLGQPDGWTDLRVDGKLFAEYRVKDWLGIDAEVNYTGYFSKVALAFPSVPGNDPLAYQQVAAFAGLRVFW
jgi:hypothetical protein